jgi:catechol 2,3-dioxygenase-like lactoylglutathione lyase family enzyme
MNRAEDGMAGTAIERIQHVSLPIPPGDDALERTRSFYRDILGMSEIDRPTTLPGRGLWFAVGDQELHILVEADAAALNPRSRRHPCFQVGDATALRSRLQNLGVATIDDDGPIRGRPRFFADDPFGNRLEFVEFEADHW